MRDAGFGGANAGPIQDRRCQTPGDATPQRPTTSRAAAEPVGITPEMRIVMGHINANSLRGDVSFLASDLLEGRDTPSRGLDIAGEYIASQFRRLGLEPVGDDGYFQTVVLKPEDPNSPSRAMWRGYCGAPIPR